MRLSTFSKNFFPVIVGIFFLVFAFNFVDLNSFVSLLGNISFSYFFIFLVFFSLTFVLVSLKWFILIKKLGGKVSFFQALKYNAMGFLISFITPTLMVGGEPLKVYMMKRNHNFSYEKSVASLIGEAVIAFPIEIFCVLVISSLVFLFANIGANIKIIYFTFSLSLLFLVAILFISIYKEKKLISNFLKLIYSFTQHSFVWKLHMKAYSSEELYIKLLRRKKVFYSMVFYSFLVVLSRIFAFIFGFLAITKSLNLSLTFLSYVAFSFTSLLPVPGSLGVQEIGQILLTRENASVVFSILLRFAYLCLLGVGLFFIVKEEVLFGKLVKRFLIKVKNGLMMCCKFFSN